MPGGPGACNGRERARAARPRRERGRRWTRRLVSRDCSRARACRCRPIRRPASIAPTTAVRAAEGEVVDLRDPPATPRLWRAAAPRVRVRHARAPVVVQLGSRGADRLGVRSAEKATAGGACGPEGLAPSSRFGRTVALFCKGTQWSHPMAASASNASGDLTTALVLVWTGSDLAPTFGRVRYAGAPITYV